MGEWSRAEKALLVLFLLTLPLVNPWVRGDGVGYYAYIRSFLIDGDLDFQNEWLAGNPTFVLPKLDDHGQLRPEIFTPTGYVDNHFTVGPAILWGPFLTLTHIAVLGLNVAGAHIPADGYSPPYVWTMGLATAFYGFLGLFLSFQLAREYFGERWAFLGTLGIWFASSLPVYMYFNPSWSHAHSAFAVALFLWYWNRSRKIRSAFEWILLGLLGGLMVDVYYPNGVVLLVPLLESLVSYAERWSRQDRGAAVARLFFGNVLFLGAFVLGFLPTLVTRKILYGSFLHSGYYALNDWSWTRPELWNVLFSANHGLLSWTPVLIPAILGLFWLRTKDREMTLYFAAALLAFYYLIASYLSWHGLSSFGNRFFISLTPIFILGLAGTFDALARKLSPRVTTSVASVALALLILWNAGLIFQWGTHMIEPRGPISWSEAARNQVTVVPARILTSVKDYLVARGALMKRIEAEDTQRLHPEKKNAK